MAFFINTARVFNEIFGSERIKDETNILEENDNSEEIIEVSPNCDCIASDFTEDMLMMEIMRLGLDPSNFSKDQMMKIIFDKMNQSKPTLTQIEEKEQEQKSKNQ